MAVVPFPRWAPIPEDLLWDRGVPDAAVRLWATIYRLGDLAGAAGHAVAIDRETVAARLDWTEKTLTKWAKVLVDRGYLEVRRPGQGKPNVYLPVFTVPEGNAPTFLERHDPSPLSSLIEIPNTEKDPAADAADKVDPDAWLKAWWEQQTPRPTQSFVAIRAIARAALRSGWELETLRRAMTEAPVISGGALDLWRSRQTNGSNGRPALHHAPGSALARGATDRTGASGEW
jgi:hypothetical protein